MAKKPVKSVTVFRDNTLWIETTDGTIHRFEGTDEQYVSIFTHCATWPILAGAGAKYVAYILVNPKFDRGCVNVL